MSKYSDQSSIDRGPRGALGSSNNGGRRQGDLPLAIWRTPNCPRGEWVLGVEDGGTLRDLEYFETKDEAERRLDELQ